MNYKEVLMSSIRADAIAQSDVVPVSLVSSLYEYPDDGAALSLGQVLSRYLHLCCAGNPTLTSPVKYTVLQGDLAVLLFIEKGGAQISQRGRTCSVPAGSFALIQADAEFTLLFTLLPCTYSFYVFTGADLVLFRFAPPAVPRAIREGPLSGHALDALRSIPADVDTDSLLRMHALLTQLLAQSTVSGKKSGGTSPAGSDPASGLPRYLDFLHSAIHTQYQDSFSLAFYERQLGVSRYRLCREYSEAFGISPLKDLNRTRIRKAEELLVSTNLQVQEIALEVGYENTNHFISLFRAQTGMTPGAYRKASWRTQD